MYADYDFYQGAYQGNLIPEAAWPAVARDASAYIDRITYGRLRHGATVTDDVRMAVCAVAEVVYAHQQRDVEQGSSGIKSENVDGYSVTYEDSAAASKQYDTDRMEAAGLFLLPGDPLRYAGVDHAGKCRYNHL